MIYEHFTAPTSIQWTLTDQGLVCQAPIWQGHDGQAPAEQLSKPAWEVLRQSVFELEAANRELSKTRTCEEDHPITSADQTPHTGFRLMPWIEVLRTPKFAFISSCANLCIATSTFDTSVFPKQRRERIDDLLCKFRKAARPCVERSAMVKASAVACKANARLRNELFAYWSQNSHNRIHALESDRLEGSNTLGPASSRPVHDAADPQVRQVIRSFRTYEYKWYSNKALDAGQVDDNTRQLIYRTFESLPRHTVSTKDTRNGVLVRGGKPRTHFFWRRY